MSYYRTAYRTLQSPYKFHSPFFGSPPSVDSGHTSFWTKLAAAKWSGLSFLKDLWRDSRCSDADPTHPLTGAISGRYFVDLDANALDDGEPGVAGAPVRLYSSSNGELSLIATTTSAEDGSYRFDGLAAGDYRVAFGTPDDIESGTYSGMQFVASDAGDDARDSDVTEPATGQTDLITLAKDEERTDVDAGLRTPNIAPIAIDEGVEGCADRPITLDFSENYSDPDSASVSVTLIDGQPIVAGGPAVSLSDGASVTLTAEDQFIFDGSSAYAALDIGERQSAAYSVTVTDSDGATAEASLEVTYCGDANSLDSWAAALPQSVTFQVRATDIVRPVETSAYDLRIVNAGTDGRLDGTYLAQAYCVSRREPISGAEDIDLAPEITGALVVFDDPNVADVFTLNGPSVFNGQTATDNLDLINWILNQDFENSGFTGWEVQRALWELTDDQDMGFLDGIDPGFGHDAQVQAILTMAAAHEGYRPGTGDSIGVLIDPDPGDPDNQQPFIAALEFEAYDCLC